MNTSKLTNRYLFGLSAIATLILLANITVRAYPSHRSDTVVPMSTIKTDMSNDRVFAKTVNANKQELLFLDEQSILLRLHGFPKSLIKLLKAVPAQENYFYSVSLEKTEFDNSA